MFKKGIILKCFIFFLFNIIIVSLFNIETKASEIELSPNSVSAVLIEASTGTIIYEKNAKERRAPASMTKIMTMILIMDAIKNNLFNMDTLLTASSNATGMGGTQIYLEVGEQMSVRDLLKAVCMASANDACVVFAEAISGNVEEFIKLMNSKATELGLLDTNFVNTNGLPATNHYSCSYDLGIMSYYLIKNYGDTILSFTNVYEDYLRKGTEDEFWLVNTNKLVKFYEEVDGLKTGWTSEAGYCLSATMNKNGIRFIAVVMGCETTTKRNSDVMNMLNYGVSTYELSKVIKAGEIVEVRDDILIKPNTFNIVASKDVTILIKKGQKIGVVTTKVKLNNDLSNLGTLEVYIDSLLYESVPLVSEIPIKKASFLHIVLEVFKNIFLKTEK